MNALRITNFSDDIVTYQNAMDRSCKQEHCSLNETALWPLIRPIIRGRLIYFLLVCFKFTLAYCLFMQLNHFIVIFIVIDMVYIYLYDVYTINSSIFIVYIYILTPWYSLFKIVYSCTGADIEYIRIYVFLITFQWKSILSSNERFLNHLHVNFHFAC